MLILFLWVSILTTTLYRNELFRKDLKFIKSKINNFVNKLIDKVWEVNIRGFRYTLIKVCSLYTGKVKCYLLVQYCKFVVGSK